MAAEVEEARELLETVQAHYVRVDQHQAGLEAHGISASVGRDHGEA